MELNGPGVRLEASCENIEQCLVYHAFFGVRIGDAGISGFHVINGQDVQIADAI